MSDFEQIVQQAVEDEDIPGCVLLATNRDGSFTYSKAFGTRSMRPTGDHSPLALNTVMWMASCTKLMTSICALQLVERGLLSLDAPIYTHIPELKDHPVLTGFADDGTPILIPHTNPITLRLLLTHSSGISYDAMHPLLQAWSKYHNKGPDQSGKLLQRFSAPLVFEPGSSWMYGAGVDYAGLMIERVSGVSLEDYMREHLWELLGISGMTFHLSKRQDLKERLADLSARDEKTGRVVVFEGQLPYEAEGGAEIEDCLGGQGIFTSGEEYIKVLRGLLTTDADEKILKKETVEMFFSPQLGEGASAMLNMITQDEATNNAMGGVPQNVKKDWGLGGLLIREDVEGKQKEGTMFWGGYPNLIWFVDRKTGLAGLYAGQVVPPGDAKCTALNRTFEKGMYELYAKSKHVS